MDANKINTALTLLELVLIEVEAGFVACDCGRQEETKTLDFVDDIKKAKEILLIEALKVV